MMIRSLGVPLLVSGLALAQESEPRPFPEFAALDAALERAAARDTRVAIVSYDEANSSVEPLVRWWRRAKLGEVPLRYEYELVPFAGDRGALGRRLKTPLIEPANALVLCAADGQVLAQHSAVLDPSQDQAMRAQMALLEKFKVAMPDAREHLAAALAQATKSDRRVLVHLGAPW